VRGVEELEGILYRVEGEEERTAWRWGAGTPAAAMNGGGSLCGGRGKAEAARDECAPAL
jgi:hypothetical protein